MTILIGILGPARAGKSTVADYIRDRYGAVKYALAEPLKQMAMTTMGFSHDQLYGTQDQKETIDPRFGISPRQYLRRLGDATRKTFGTDVWVNHLIENVRADQPELAVVEDVRFVNEATKLRDFETFHITGAPLRRGFVWRLTPLDPIEPEHASEAEWVHAPYDYAIAPLRRDLVELHRLVDDACRHYKVFPKRREQSI